MRQQQGFSTVEALLAAVVFGLLATAIVGAIIYGRGATATAGDRVRATMLAEECVEGVKNIRDSGFANLVDGTHGLVQSGNQWTLSGTQDTNGMFTRQAVVAASGTNRKSVTCRVNWTQGAVVREAQISTQLSNWMANVVIPKSWTNALRAGAYNASSTNNGLKVAVQGDYAYMVRADGTQDFIIMNIANPTAPVLVGSLSLTGAPTNIAVSGSYAYVSNSSDTAEMQIINVATPSAPTVVANYNATDTNDALDVAVSGAYAYLVRASDTTNGTNELVIINVSSPGLPITLGGYNSNVTMREVYLSGSHAYIATDSDTQELLVVNVSSVLLPLLAASVNLSGTNNAITVDGFGATVLVGQGAVLWAINVATPASPSVAGSFTSSGTINDIDTNSPANAYAFIGTTATAAEFQVVNIANLTSMSLADTVDITGTTSTVTGVGYDAVRDAVIAATASDTEEAVIITPN